jgi:hypothetical protein
MSALLKLQSRLRGMSAAMIERFNNFVRRLSFLPPLPVRLPVRCSFCHRPYEIAGPFAEGYNSVLICGKCVATCGELIAKERERLTAASASANPIDVQSG